MTRDRGALLGLVTLTLALGAYPSSYGVLRLTRVLVHHSSFISAEGWDAYWWHAIRAPSSPLGRGLETVYRPLLDLETAVHERGGGLEGVRLLLRSRGNASG